LKAYGDDPVTTASVHSWKSASSAMTPPRRGASVGVLLVSLTRRSRDEGEAALGIARGRVGATGVVLAGRQLLQAGPGGILVGDLQGEHRGRTGALAVTRDDGQRDPVTDPRGHVLAVGEVGAGAVGLDLLEHQPAQVVPRLEVELLLEPGELLEDPHGLDLLLRGGVESG
jgi:hypothetical protein